MTILGIGIDIVEINRIKKILKGNRSFIDRIYTKHEKSSKKSKIYYSDVCKLFTSTNFQKFKTMKKSIYSRRKKSSLFSKEKIPVCEKITVNHSRNFNVSVKKEHYHFV